MLAVEHLDQGTGLIAVADKYQALGQNALAEFSWADTKIRGIQKAVRDTEGDGVFSDDYTVQHDVLSPIT